MRPSAAAACNGSEADLILGQRRRKSLIFRRRDVPANIDADS